MTKAKITPPIAVTRAQDACFADGFKELESDIRDLRRAAALAARQLEAVIMADDQAALVELADYAVNHTRDVAERLEKRWHELHSRACEAGRSA